MRQLAALLLCASTLPAHATDAGNPAAKARTYALEAMASWAADPVLIAAVRDQNLRHDGLSQTDIDALDMTWRAELGKSVHPVVDSVVQTVPSDLLRAAVEASTGLMTEVFVMDALGLNVAASAATSDYWQGDEAKFTETFPKGAEAIHVSDVEFDESTQMYQIQVSFSLTDPADGAVIGAVTVALNAENL
ncbi:PDC sensor domain-containing protein [Pseudotabrizicola algicola]|uniref:Uncharacterized protein n=1 Tax=Pseudotabrizicola algicola TaxID=2709381 RepID=A0A6B3RNZ6_9RHOB|nr:PDC sensor domain-containing protein [Pseudotabrizicola algicola]NEX44772.1 hypothetical protein [Pseudotabrizicola algicola]